MPRDNVEIVRRVYDEWARGNMNAAVDLFDPELVFESFMPDANERVVARGPEGVEAFMREFLGQWRNYRLMGSEFRSVGRDRVFVAGRQTATGRQSGVAVDDTMHSVWTFRDDQVVHLLFERDREKALEAAGLRA
jgi:ketosteroid isomerase-like protein